MATQHIESPPLWLSEHWCLGENGRTVVGGSERFPAFSSGAFGAGYAPYAPVYDPNQVSPRPVITTATTT
jgi:hypothetical protein